MRRSIVTKIKKVHSPSQFSASFILLISIIFSPFGGSLAASHSPYSSIFDSFAEELVTGIRNANFSDVPTSDRYQKPQVVIVPLRSTIDDPLTINPSFLVELNSNLTASVLWFARKQLNFLSFDAVINRFQEQSRHQNDLGKIMHNPNVDIVITGSIRRLQNGITISYKAINAETGSILSATPSRFVSLPGETNQSLKNGYTKSKIFSLTKLQRLLIRFGYRPGRADGVMDDFTRQAIRLFEWDNGLPVTGQPSTRVYALLNQKSSARNLGKKSWE